MNIGESSKAWVRGEKGQRNRWCCGALSALKFLVFAFNEMDTLGKFFRRELCHLMFEKNHCCIETTGGGAKVKAGKPIKKLLQ